MASVPRPNIQAGRFRLPWIAMAGLVTAAHRPRLGRAWVVLVILSGSLPPGCTNDGAVEGSESDSDFTSDHGDGDGGSSPGDEPEGCDGGCVDLPSDCHVAPGTCEEGSCRYTPKLAGEVCETGCEAGGFCDASGNCICTDRACDATCTAGPNATATCSPNGECIRSCESPWENCDGDWANGCEVPVGMPGVCDLDGLNLDDGCWTAYCGQSAGGDAYDFGTYYCVSCSTCNAPADGMCRWCNRETGRWYATESCSCSEEHLDLACDP
jgi:hypothetical protein